MNKQNYIVGYSEGSLDKEEFIILQANDKQDAINKFLYQYGINDRFFLEYVYDQSVNMSFAEHFWLETKEEENHFTETGEVLIEKDIFNERVKIFFDQHQDFADLYIKHYWGILKTA